VATSSATDLTASFPAAPATIRIALDARMNGARSSSATIFHHKYFNYSKTRGFSAKGRWLTRDRWELSRGHFLEMQRKLDKMQQDRSLKIQPFRNEKHYINQNG
jgi:galactose mutarotase-like enzyme